MDSLMSAHLLIRHPIQLFSTSHGAERVYQSRVVIDDHAVHTIGSRISNTRRDSIIDSTTADEPSNSESPALSSDQEPAAAVRLEDCNDHRPLNNFEYPPAPPYAFEYDVPSLTSERLRSLYPSRRSDIFRGWLPAGDRLPFRNRSPERHNYEYERPDRNTYASPVSRSGWMHISCPIHVANQAEITT